MDRITRKSLKDDRFAAEVTHSVEYLAEHRRQALLYGGIGAAVLAVALGAFFYIRHRQNAAHMALYKALETYHALVTEEERPGRITFHTEQEKQKQSLKEFEQLFQSYPRSTEGRMARYYSALVQKEMGNTAEAQKRLEQAAADGPPEVSGLARLELAQIYIAQKKDEEARKQYDHLIKNPTSTVPESRARLEMARYLRSRNPDEARKLLADLQKRTGPISIAAGSLLREMGQKN